MRKVLLVCDGNHFPNGAFELVKTLNKTSPVLLTGVFLSSVQYSDLWFYPADGSGDILATIMDEDYQIIAKNIDAFTARCQQHNIDYRVHSHADDFIFAAVKKETRFADLMLMSSETFYANVHAKQPNSYTKTILHEAECPVLMVPENAVPPSNLILAYDDSEASVYAIKQFAYLLPEWCGLPTVFVYANRENDGVPDLKYIEEFAARHFNQVSFEKLQVEPDKYFNTWAKHFNNGLVVTGSFGRSVASAFFKQSFITESIRDHESLVFVAHK